MLMYKCPLQTKYIEIESEIDSILESVTPQFSKAIPDICTMGVEQGVEPSERNPAVVIVRCGEDDRQRAALAHDRIIELLRERLPHPCPPFRWIVHEFEPY